MPTLDELESRWQPSSRDVIRAMKEWRRQHAKATFQEIESAYTLGKVHPMDLKNGVATELAAVLEPVRRYFANNKEAKDCLETVRQAKITR
jgi:tryptophanyl-tRNA synthetase